MANAIGRTDKDCPVALTGAFECFCVVILWKLAPSAYWRFALARGVGVSDLDTNVSVRNDNELGEVLAH